MTTLRHISGARILMDVSKSIKLTSPAFSLKVDGISEVTLDTFVTSGTVRPVYIRKDTGEVIDNVSTDVICTCSGCYAELPAGEMLFADRIGTICKNCVEAIGATSATSGASAETKSKGIQLCAVFGLRRGKLPVVPAVSVLLKEFSL